MNEPENLQTAINDSPFWDVDLSIRKSFFRALLKKLNSGEPGEKVREALKYMKAEGYTSAAVLENEDVKQEVAKAVDILPVALCEALSDKSIVTDETPTLEPEWEEMYRTVWAQTMRLFPKQTPSTLTKAFFQAAGSYQRQPERKKDSFCAYLTTILRHIYREEAEKEKQQLVRLSKESARRVRNALEYMADMGYTIGMVLHDETLEETVAKSADIGRKLLHEALSNKDVLVSLDGSSDADDNESDIQLADESQNVETQIEEKDSPVFPLLHKVVLLMNLEEKEKYRRQSILYWSPRILGYLRNKEEPETEERLVRCDDLRPLEKDGILWDQLLLRDYVKFTVQEPLYSGKGPEDVRELEGAALNALVDLERRPEQDQTVALYTGKDKGTIAYHKNKIEAAFLQMMRNGEE